MDEQEFLHRLSVKTNVNIEFLKDLYRNNEFLALIQAGKTIDATIRVRRLQPRIGLVEAKMIAEAFSAELRS
jgi:hypothetical protein